jgi:hypothetical protein
MFSFSYKKGLAMYRVLAALVVMALLGAVTGFVLEWSTPTKSQHDGSTGQTEKLSDTLACEQKGGLWWEDKECRFPQNSCERIGNHLVQIPDSSGKMSAVCEPGYTGKTLANGVQGMIDKCSKSPGGVWAGDHCSCPGGYSELENSCVKAAEPK